LERGVIVRARGGNGLVLGDFVVIGSYSVLEVSSGLARNHGFIRIGARSSIGDYCYVGGAGGVNIGEGVLIGQYVSLHSQNHRFENPCRPIREQGVTSVGIAIADDCWIGAGAKILDGVNIGVGSVIAAGAVVTKSIPPYSVVAGVPGRVVRTRGRKVLAK
jgi:acetyltransferase-like isoleucine patch superfamily enzyme